METFPPGVVSMVAAVGAQSDRSLLNPYIYTLFLIATSPLSSNQWSGERKRSCGVTAIKGGEIYLEVIYPPWLLVSVGCTLILFSVSLRWIESIINRAGKV